jgi:hypothetical protein
MQIPPPSYPSPLSAVQFAQNHEDQVPEPNALQRGEVGEVKGVSLKKTSSSPGTKDSLAQAVKFFFQIDSLSSLKAII